MANVAGASDREVLEAFVVGNRDLEELETHLAVFNIFEAVGAVRQELRHSDFLSFLLSPAQNHGLRDSFLKRFLKRVLVNAEDPPVGAVEIDVADMSDADVRREWRNLDILVQSPSNNLIVVVENKIGTGEHSNQLRRYRELAMKEFPDRLRVHVFLTPDGIAPSDPTWIPFSYADVAEIADDLIRAHSSTLGDEVLALISHYSAMLRRHVVSDSHIIELCQRIYQRHKGALDLIYEHKPDLQADLAALCRELIAEEHQNGIADDHSSKSYIRFTAAEWDSEQALMSSKGWTRSGRMLLFEVWNFPEALSLKLMLGPGPAVVRNVLHELALSEPKAFQGASKRQGKQWTSLYTMRIFSKGDYEDAEFDALANRVRTKWHQFRDVHFPEIRQRVSEIDWSELDLDELAPT